MCLVLSVFRLGNERSILGCYPIRLIRMLRISSWKQPYGKTLVKAWLANDLPSATNYHAIDLQSPVSLLNFQFSCIRGNDN